MAVKGRKLELTCILCSNPLTSRKSSLADEALTLIAEQNVLRKTVNDHTDYNRYLDIDKDQVVATKCGHMFHMGCLRSYVKSAIEKKGTAFCPICTKPVGLTRIWPVLIPATPCQAAKFKKLADLKEHNLQLRDDLKEIRQTIHERNHELNKKQKQISQCLEDIQEKQSQLEQIAGPTEEDLEELRKIHNKRQAIVRVVTKHNGELLELLMLETNVQISDISDMEKEPRHGSNAKTKKSRHRRVKKTRYRTSDKTQLRTSNFGLY